MTPEQIEEVAELLHMGMMCIFGISWPLNVIKSWKARTAEGKSLPFLIIVIVGYFIGIAGRIIKPGQWYVMFFYILNLTMVIADLALYIRNCHLDKLRDKEKNKQA